MAGMMSFIGIALGGTAAYFADRFPIHVEVIETSAGVLLIGGLALLGSALPAIF